MNRILFFGFFFVIAGCGSMQPVSSCHDTKMICPIGTQKECEQEQEHVCECKCHQLNDSPFTPVDETGEKDSN